MTAIPVMIRGVAYDAATALPLTLGQIRRVFNEHEVDLSKIELGDIPLTTKREMALLVLWRLSGDASAEDVDALTINLLDQIVGGMIASARIAP